MKLTNTSHPPTTGYVLVLLDGSEKDLLGVWGAYPDEASARWAMGELNLWPIDGIWDIVPLKWFPVPASTTTGNTDYQIRNT